MEILSHFQDLEHIAFFAAGVILGGLLKGIPQLLVRRARPVLNVIFFEEHPAPH